MSGPQVPNASLKQIFFIELLNSVSKEHYYLLLSSLRQTSLSCHDFLLVFFVGDDAVSCAEQFNALAAMYKPGAVALNPQYVLVTRDFDIAHCSELIDMCEKNAGSVDVHKSKEIPGAYIVPAVLFHAAKGLLRNEDVETGLVRMCRKYPSHETRDMDASLGTVDTPDGDMDTQVFGVRSLLCKPASPAAKRRTDDNVPNVHIFQLTFPDQLKEGIVFSIDGDGMPRLKLPHGLAMVFYNLREETVGRCRTPALRSLSHLFHHHMPTSVVAAKPRQGGTKRKLSQKNT